jgi:hypothetical protein
MVVIIVLVLVGWAVASVVVAVLAATVFRGARIGPATITLPPEQIDLTGRSPSVSYTTEQPGQDTSPSL